MGDFVGASVSSVFHNRFSITETNVIFSFSSSFFFFFFFIMFGLVKCFSFYALNDFISEHQEAHPEENVHYLPQAEVHLELDVI